MRDASRPPERAWTWKPSGARTARLKKLLSGRGWPVQSLILERGEPPRRVIAEGTLLDARHSTQYYSPGCNKSEVTVALADSRQHAYPREFGGKKVRLVVELDA